MLDIISRHAAVTRHVDAPIRRLCRAEAFRAARFVGTLPEQTRYRRFHCAMSLDMVGAHYDALDWDTVIVLAWIERGETRGLAEVHPYPAHACRETEIALSLQPFAVGMDGQKSRHSCLSEGHDPNGNADLSGDRLDLYSGHFGLALLVDALSRAAATGARRSRILLCPPDPVQAGFGRRLGAVFDAAEDALIFTH